MFSPFSPYRDALCARIRSQIPQHLLSIPLPSPALTHPDQRANLLARQLSRYVTRRGPKVPIRPLSPLVQRVACAASSPSFPQQRTCHLPPSPHWLLPGLFSLSSEQISARVYIAKLGPSDAHIRRRRRLVKCSVLGKRADRLARRDDPGGLQRETHNRLFILSITGPLSAFFRKKEN